MKLYLAGGISGNLSADWKRLTLNGGGYENLFSREASLQERNEICRGGQRPYVLESFYYCRKNPWLKQILPLLGDFLLDSGAFTFMQDESTHLDWDKYTEEYAEWVVENNIEKFFELDIDSVIGLAEVERLRKRLEDASGRKPIPVWHRNRGLDYFKQMCEQYPYVALGGFVKAGDGKRGGYEKAFPWFIREAHQRGAKIHGLGYTNIAGLHRYHFDSIDSTSWLHGNRGGYLYRFNALRGDMERYQPEERGRLQSHEAATHNFLEWIKFQYYAEKYL